MHAQAHVNETQVSPTPKRGLWTSLTDRRWPRKNAAQPLALTSRNDELSEDEGEMSMEPSSPSPSSSTNSEVNTPIQSEDESTFIVGEQDQDYEIEVGGILVDELEMSGYLTLPSSPSYSYSGQLQELRIELGQMRTERDNALNELNVARQDRDTAIQAQDTAIQARDTAIQERDGALQERDGALQERNAAYRFIAGILSGARAHVPKALSFVEANITSASMYN